MRNDRQTTGREGKVVRIVHRENDDVIGFFEIAPPIAIEQVLVLRRVSWSNTCHGFRIRDRICIMHRTPVD
jgi:hypothetical protein